MVASWVHELGASDSRKHKESVIEKALIASKLGSSDAQSFLFNCYQTYNPYYTFNVKQVPETHDIVNASNPWTHFWALLESLRLRDITGNEARTAIREISTEFDSDEWNTMCRRVLLKDLRVGVSLKTLNNVLKNSTWEIPVFECQLAKDSTQSVHQMTGKKRLEVKLDGVRVLAVVTPSSVTLFSRNGKPFHNFPHIEEYLANTRKMWNNGASENRPYVLDGEIVSDSFQSLMKQAHRKKHANAKDSVFHIFDFIPFTQFSDGIDRTSQQKRTEHLEHCARFIDGNAPVTIIPGIEVDLDTSAGHSKMKQFADNAIEQGFEGIMIKNLDAGYECKRSTNWLKWKPVITVDLSIVAVEEGTGRNAGRLGALVCAGQDDGKDIRVNVGSGFTDDNRTSYWNSRDALIGQLVEVQADAVTKNQDGTHSLRFPRFLRFRDLDKGSKI